MKKTLVTSLLLCCLFLCSCRTACSKDRHISTTFSDVTFYAGDQVIGNYQNVSINADYRDKIDEENDEFYYQVIDTNDKIIAEYSSSTIFKAIP